MSAGLPIACSNQSSMNEILANGGLYFDPTDVSSIANAIEKFLVSPVLREEKQREAQALAKQYLWSISAQKTMAFLHMVTENYSKSNHKRN
jgi:glycosyltransferase involved in cell wall biosynthesis